MPTQHLASRQTPTMVLDPASPVPLYHQLQKALEQTWRAQFGPDDDLATEKEIMDQFNVSRITVRRLLATALPGCLRERRNSATTMSPCCFSV